jgi:hypothetical protein
VVVGVSVVFADGAADGCCRLEPVAGACAAGPVAGSGAARAVRFLWDAVGGRDSEAAFLDFCDDVVVTVARPTVTVVD